MPADQPTDAFVEFSTNLDYARNLVNGGRSLERLQVGAFDYTDVYRAALVQGVAAFDHWLFREAVQRAVLLIQRPNVPRPGKFNDITLTVKQFEAVHHHGVPLDEEFRARAEEFFAGKLSPNPSKIRDSFTYLRTGSIWPDVAKELTSHREDGTQITPNQVTERLDEIVKRRNAIAHQSDKDSANPGHKSPITSRHVADSIDWIELIAAAILRVLDTP